MNGNDKFNKGLGVTRVSPLNLTSIIVRREKRDGRETGEVGVKSSSSRLSTTSQDGSKGSSETQSTERHSDSLTPKGEGNVKERALAGVTGLENNSNAENVGLDAVVGEDTRQVGEMAVKKNTEERSFSQRRRSSVTGRKRNVSRQQSAAFWQTNAERINIMRRDIQRSGGANQSHFPSLCQRKSEKRRWDSRRLVEYPYVCSNTMRLPTIVRQLDSAHQPEDARQAAYDNLAPLTFANPYRY